MPRMSADDLGTPYDGPRPAARVVSLVPSITEALASVRRDAVVGATDWCTHPADLDDSLEARVRGTKNPDLAAIGALRPDVVVANKEENRELDVRRLREAGTRVWVTDIETVPQAVTSLERLLDALGWDRPAWLAQVRDEWCGDLPPVTRKVAVAVWRDPWMVVGRDTFTGDLVRRLGWHNVYVGEQRPLPHGHARGPRPRRRRRRTPPRRALRVHRGRRSGGVRADADRAGQRPPADLVRPLAARGPALQLPGPTSLSRS